jgi:neutral ceramidase
MNRRAFLRLSCIGLAAWPATDTIAKSAWTAGVGRADITPDRSLWMAGFARRTLPSQGVALPLFAKALALRQGSGRPIVLVTTDLLGLTSRITDRVAATLERRHGLLRAEILFNASHTHCGPVVDEQLSVTYDLTPAQWADIGAYTTELEARLVRVVDDAVAAMVSVRLAYARGEATFAANRRVQFTPDGPVDHSVPVLRVDRVDGLPLAIVFGYACHNTTLPETFVQYHGDYAGVAQAVLEARHAGVTALFVSGCGADANPKPRGTIELVQTHGAALADAVDRALPSATPVVHSVHAAYHIVTLPFVGDDARKRWHDRLDIEDVFLRRHAALMDAAIAHDGRLPDAQPDPVQVWTFGPDLMLVALGGEVVVDYALRLAREFHGRRVWVAGYSNDVFGYVPSVRVLREGGYEGGDAMIYYGRPAPFTEEVEDRIVSEVHRLAARSPR